MTITKLIKLLELHKQELGDTEVTGFKGFIIGDKGELIIQTDSNELKKLYKSNLRSILLNNKEIIMKFYDNN